MSTQAYTQAQTQAQAGAWLALGRGVECAERLREWYRLATRSLAYTGEYVCECEHVSGRIYAGLSHCDETAQANGYAQDFERVHMRNAYRPDTLVWRDGGTEVFRNPARNTQTYSLAEARTWYVAGECVLVYRDCARTVVEILNPTKSLTRKLKGNGKIKYYRHARGDAWREGGKK